MAGRRQVLDPATALWGHLHRRNPGDPELLELRRLYLRQNTGSSTASPAYTRHHRNPFREWIGAQIRCDAWAWAAAGKPELAAEFAYRDACWTHTRNGIYGAMFFAAIQAAAFVESSPRTLIEIGLSEIPADCRLARCVRTALCWHATCADFWSALDRMDQDDALVRMNAVHTINNAVLCVLSLLYSVPTIDEATCNVVMAGLDTDSNGATVGSVAGAITGFKADSGILAPRLNDSIRPRVFGFERVTSAPWPSGTPLCGTR